MDDMEIRILDRFSTREGLIFTVRDDGRYRVGQTVRVNGICYTITGIHTNSSLSVIGLKVVRKA